MVETLEQVVNEQPAAPAIEHPAEHPVEQPAPQVNAQPAQQPAERAAPAANPQPAQQPAQPQVQRTEERPIEERTDEIIDKFAASQFLIDPKMKYYSDLDPVPKSKSKAIREEFIKKADNLFDLEKYFYKLRQNDSDVDAISDFTKKVMKGMPKKLPEEDKKTIAKNIVERLQEPNRALHSANKFVDAGYSAMAELVENGTNRDRILKKLSAEQLESVLQNPNLTFYANGKYKHDRASYLINKLNQLRNVTAEQGGIIAVIQNETNELIKYIPEEQNLFRQICPKMNSSLAESIAKAIEKAREGLFKDGKDFDKKAMIKYLEDNYKVVEDVMKDDDRDQKEKGDRWNDNLKMHYVELARALLGPEKKQYKLDEDEDKEDRKAKDKTRGLKT